MTKRTDLIIDLDVYDSTAQKSARWVTHEDDQLERNDLNTNEISGDLNIAEGVTYTLPGIGAGESVVAPRVVFIEASAEVRFSWNAGTQGLRLVPQSGAQRVRTVMEVDGITSIEIENPTGSGAAITGKFIVVGDPSV